MYYVVTEYPPKDIVVDISNCKGMFGFVFVFVKACMYHSISTNSGQYLYSKISVFITFLSNIHFPNRLLYIYYNTVIITTILLFPKTIPI
ncbi:hypothetical protein BH10PAT4_BH10PAT4_1730 [soil metagenome]